MTNRPQQAKIIIILDRISEVILHKQKIRIFLLNLGQKLLI